MLMMVHSAVVAAAAEAAVTVNWVSRLSLSLRGRGVASGVTKRKLKSYFGEQRFLYVQSAVLLFLWH